MLKKLMAVVVFALCAAVSAHAADVYVNANAAEEGDGSEKSPFKTLAYAIDNMPKGTTRLLLADGTYPVSSTLTLNMIIESQSGNAANCIIDGEYKCRLFKQTDAAQFKGVTLRNGIATDNANGGNTVNNTSGKGLGFYDCIIEGGITTNTAGAVAGNIWMPSGALIVSNCVIRNNYVYDTVDGWGGGGFVAMQNGSPTYKFYNTVASNNVFELNSGVRNDRGGTVIFTNAGCELYDCTFVDNLTTNRGSGWARGGVVYARGGTVKAERCAFVRNTAPRCGSAIYGAANLETCVFTNNLSCSGGSRDGGNNGTVVGITVTAIGCDFYGNTNNYYGAISASSSAMISNCTFACNKGTRGAAVFCANNLTLMDSTFTRNETQNGLLATESNNKVGSGNAIVDRCTFKGTSATGSVLYDSEGNGTGMTTNVCIRNSVVTGCTGTSLGVAECCNTIPAAGRTFDNGYGVYFQNLTVTNNALSAAIVTCGGGMGITNQDMWFIENCDLRNNGTKKIMTGTAYQDRARHCLVDTGATNIRLVSEDDPDYIGNRTDGKFKEKGIVSAWMTQVAKPLDYFGNPRIRGAKPDIGAIEWPKLGLMLILW